MTNDTTYTSSFTIAQKIGVALGYAIERAMLRKGQPFLSQAVSTTPSVTGMNTTELARLNIECALSMANLLNQLLPHLNDYEAAHVLALLGEEGQTYISPLFF